MTIDFVRERLSCPNEKTGASTQPEVEEDEEKDDSDETEAYRYLARSLKTFPTAEEVAMIMEGAGLRTVRHRRYNMGAVAIHVGTKE